MEKKDNYLVTTTDSTHHILDSNNYISVSAYNPVYIEDLIVEKAEFLTKDAIIKLLQNRFNNEYFSLVEQMNEQNYKTKLKQILVM